MSEKKEKLNSETLLIIITFFSILITINIIIPSIMSFFDLNSRLLFIYSFTTVLMISIIILIVIDLIFLVEKKNYPLISFITTALIISVFLLLAYCFLFDLFDVFYVWNYSESTLHPIYKFVAIWAGPEGSLLTWIVCNFIFISFFRIKNKNKDDSVFIGAIIISLTVSITFMAILIFLDPFKIVHPTIFPLGRGLSPILRSPYMIIHPIFVFLGYAVFLIPFSVIISEIISKNSKLKTPYSKSYFDFTMRFGWLVISLGIGIGAYWASLASGWGRYWGWDPVETVSLIPWFLSTAFFHAKIAKTENKYLIKFNVLLIFLSMIFSTLITRGGGLNSIHSFAGGEALIIWVAIIGIIILAFSLYIIYNILNQIIEEYKDTRKLFNYLSYIFLVAFVFICTIGLMMPTFSYFLSYYTGSDIIYIGASYYSVIGLVLAAGLAISLIFCSLINHVKIKWISLLIIIGFIFFGIVSLIIFLINPNMFINPVISIYLISIFSTIYNILKNFTFKNGAKNFFKINSKNVIHLGLSLLLIGTLVSNWFLIQSIFFISGFFILISGIFPSIIVIFIVKNVPETKQ